MQAATREEFDNYLDVIESTSPATAAAGFAKKWPQSELLPHVYLIEAEARRSFGETVNARRAAENALQAAKDHIPALVFLAEIISNSAEAKDDLKIAETHARRALHLLETFRVPKSVPLEEFETARDRMRSRSHATFGLIAFKREETKIAIQEFEAAEAIMPEPDPVILYRLGKLYCEVGRIADCIARMKQVTALGEPTLKLRAQKELHQVGR